MKIMLTLIARGYDESAGARGLKYETNARFATCAKYDFQGEQRPEVPQNVKSPIGSRLPIPSGNIVQLLATIKQYFGVYMHLGGLDDKIHRVLNTDGDIGTIDGQDSYNNVKNQVLREQGS
ncbi:hypothetical protein Tco_1394181 [Tanacetum coccineum]